MSRHFVVALLGPDGAGKSTLADGVEQALERSGLSVKRQHWRPERLPGTGRPRSYTELSEIRSMASRGAAPSAVMMFVYLVDFWLGKILDRPETAGGSVLLAERWYYDIVLDPARYRLRALSPLARLLVRTAPTPDLCVCLTGSPAAIAARKNELTEDEVRDQLERIDAVMDRTHQRQVLHLSTTDAEPAESIAMIVGKVTALMSSHASL